MMVTRPKPTYTIRTFSGARQELKSRMIRGAVAVEFAILLIPMLMLALGAAEYGRAIYQYNALVKTVRDSARLLSQYNPNADPNGYAAALTQARCLAVHGNTGCTGSTLAPKLTTGMVKIASAIVTTAAGTVVTLVEVKIEGYEFEFVLDPLRLMGTGNNTLAFADIRATMRQL
jgi:Flp pilus assembly protein TadG